MFNLYSSLVYYYVYDREKRKPPVLDALDKACGQYFTAYPNVITFNTVMYC